MWDLCEVESRKCAMLWEAEFILVYVHERFSKWEAQVFEDWSSFGKSPFFYVTRKWEC
jgi:hypothetical protein